MRTFAGFVATGAWRRRARTGGTMQPIPTAGKAKAMPHNKTARPAAPGRCGHKVPPDAAKPGTKPKK